MNPVFGPVMGPPTIGLFDFIGAAIRPEAELWAGEVRLNGGLVVNEDVALASAFIAASDAIGVWALLHDYWPFWAPNEVQALVSIKQRRLATAVDAPTFTANRGYAFNGSSQYIDTGFIPSTHGGSGTDQRLEVYERTNVSSSGVSAGVVDTVTRALTLTNRNGTVATGRANAAGVDFTLGTANSRGLKAVSRAGGGTTIKMFDRDVKLTDGTATTPGTAAPTRAIYIGALNNMGAASNFRAASVGAAGTSLSMTDAQAAGHYANVQAWAAARGAQV